MLNSLKNKINSSEIKIKELEEEITIKDQKIQEMSTTISSNIQKSNLSLQEVIRKQQKQIIKLQMSAKEWENHQVLIDQQETTILELQDIISQWKEKYEKQLQASNRSKPSFIPEIITSDSTTDDHKKVVTRKQSAPLSYDTAQRIKASTAIITSRRHSSFISPLSQLKSKEMTNDSAIESAGRKDLSAQDSGVLSTSLPNQSSMTALIGPVVVVNELEDHSFSDNEVNKENSESDEFSDQELIFF